jgi:N utilization substance protein B
MGMRRRSRELAMQVLFAMDIQNAFSREMFDLFVDNFDPPAILRPFLSQLIHGVIDHRRNIDALIERYSDHWKIGRMAGVDRNVLRLAVYELLYCSDVPRKVAINEAIDIGKKFGTDESGAFVNGIVDRIRLALDAGELYPVGEDAEKATSSEPEKELT